MHFGHSYSCDTVYLASFSVQRAPLRRGQPAIAALITIVGAPSCGDGMSLGRWARELLDTLTARAIRTRLDRRRLQDELDIHRLYLLTSLHARRTTGMH